MLGVKIMPNGRLESDSEHNISRRALLKFAAGAPLALAFGMVASPFARFLKPSMEPGGFFQSADLPQLMEPIEFKMSEFPQAWMWYVFDYREKFVVFNAEREQIRSTVGLIFRSSSNQMFAYSLRCNRGCQLAFKLKYDGCCGCKHSYGAGCGCGASTKGPSLYCPKGHLVFDLENQQLLAGSFWPRQFNVVREGERISVVGFEVPGIA